MHPINLTGINLETPDKAISFLSTSTKVLFYFIFIFNVSQLFESSIVRQHLARCREESNISSVVFALFGGLFCY